MGKIGQPLTTLTSGHWDGNIWMKGINDFILAESDVITFHSYCDKDCTKGVIKEMQK